MITTDLIDVGAFRQGGWRNLAPQYTAVVHAIDGVRFVTTASSRSTLFERLGDYVLTNAEYRLWPADSIVVVDKFRRGELEAAVECYFNRVGSRWDAEWLVCIDANAC